VSHQKRESFDSWGCQSQMESNGGDVEMKKKIEQLREAVQDVLTPYYDTDWNLLRWLQGHDSNLDVILPKLRSHLTFRRLWNLDGMPNGERNHPVHQYWQGGLTGKAVKTGNVLVNVEQTGSNDYWGMLHTFPINELMKARLFDLETMLRHVMEAERETGEQHSVMYIMDLTGLKYDRRLVSLMTGALASISAFMAEHYVEMIHSFVLVNAPSFITAIWTIARPLLPERTKRKVKILGGNWRSDVLELAIPEALPSFWNEEEDHVFKADLKKAVPVSIERYYNGQMPEEADTILIGARKTGTHSVSIVAGQRLSWIIETDGHFGYTLYFSDKSNSDLPCENNMEMVYPFFTNVPGPTIVPLSDKLHCDRSGEYIFWFSNEHAWIHTLKIRISLSIHSGDG